MNHASVLVSAIYPLLPIAATFIALVQARWRRNANPIRELLVTAVTGAVGGLILVQIYMHMFSGVVPMSQVGMACYWGVAVACAIRALNDILAWGFGRMIPRGANGKPCCEGSIIAAAFIRAVLLLAVGIPYVAGMLLIYHPHMLNEGTPSSVLGSSYSDVSFRSTDGVRLRGWWIPARAPADDEAEGPDWGQRTVILCHGFNVDKAKDLALARDLVPHGFNILAFDFRAHGQSDGQLSTFGDLERRDVLGAVRWLQQNHAAESRKIFGLGEGMGAAALIAAAADPNEGQAISAIAVFGPYDSLRDFIGDIAIEHSVPIAGWLATRLALPVAGMQLGTPLSRFSPQDEIDKIAPRPVLVIATQSDDQVDFAASQTLYDRASQPKLSYWIKTGNRNWMLFENQNASRSVRVFFETAREIL